MYFVVQLGMFSRGQVQVDDNAVNYILLTWIIEGERINMIERKAMHKGADDRRIRQRDIFVQYSMRRKKEGDE